MSRILGQFRRLALPSPEKLGSDDPRDQYDRLLSIELAVADQHVVLKDKP
jgi:hypothetical protein